MQVRVEIEWRGPHGGRFVLTTSVGRAELYS